MIENLGEQNGIVTLRKDSTENRFVIFRRARSVPPEVAKDPALEFYKRQNVKQREVVLAFGVDDQDHLKPIEDASALGSVSSFLPLVEERSGAKFLIQADFLVQPGRGAIQYELAWNRWSVHEAAEAAKEAIEHFKNHPNWRTQFLPILNFKPYFGQAAFDKLFRPKLHEPITTYLKEAEVYPTALGNHVKPEQAVQLDEKLNGLLADTDLPSLFGGRTDLHLAEPSLDVHNTSTDLRPLVKTVNLAQVARNEKLLAQKLNEKNHIRWFIKLYTAMAETGQQFKTQQYRTARGQYHSYDSPIYVLTDKDTITLANSVYLRDIPSEVLLLRKRFTEVDSLLSSYQLIHPRLQTSELAKFFKEFTHVQAIDYDRICRDVFLPKLRVSSQAPSKNELVAYTRLVQKGPSVSDRIWVATKSRNIKPSNQVFFGEAFSPSENWEKNERYSPQIDFLSAEYLQGVPQAEVSAWKEFFTKVGVKEQADNPYVEEFAMAFVEDKLSSQFTNFIPKDRQQHGYDREAARIIDNSVVYMEIKGQKAEQRIELTGNEPKAAQQARQNNQSFWLCVVPGIPENPQLWVVDKPLDAGEFRTVTIDVSK